MQLVNIVLNGLGLVALALSAPTERILSTSALAIFLLDTETQAYHCAGKDVIRCDTTAGGSCLAVNYCETYCFKHDKGAACVDMADVVEAPSSNVDTPNSKETVFASDIENAARGASPQENKHYICSKNRRSVLVCRYGFCSTDHYCKSSEECKDGPPGCRSKLLYAQASTSEFRAVTNRGEAMPSRLVTRHRGSKDKSTHICSKDRTNVLRCLHGFCATDYHCAKAHPCVDNPARCKKA